MYLQLKLVVALLLCSTTQVVKSSHFRGGIIMVRPQPGGVENEMEISYRISWRRDSSGGGRCDSNTVEQNILLAGEGSMTCQSGCSGTITPMQYICTDFSVEENWSYGENRISYIFSTSNANIRIGFSGNAWIAPFNSNWNVPTTFSTTRRNDTGRINSTPRAITSPVIRLQHGCNHTLPIAVSDPDGDIVKCRWAVGYNECGGICGGTAFPDALLYYSTCTLTYEANDKVNDFYAAAIMIEDFLPGSSEPLSSVALQFLVYIYSSTASCTDKPQFVPPTILSGSCIAIPSGAMFTAQIVVSSGGDSVSITEFQTTSPVGLRRSEIQQIQATDKYSINVTWTPQPDQENQTHIFCYSAINSAGQASIQNCIQFLSGYFPPIPQPMLAQTLVHPLNATFVLQFDQTIQPSSLPATIGFFDSLTELMVYQINVSFSAEIIFNKSRIIVTPKYHFKETTRYYITLDRGVVNSLEGCGPGNEPITDETFWTFETKDITPPVITFTSIPVRSNQNITISWMSNEEVSYVCSLLFQGKSSLINNCSQGLWMGYNLLEGLYQLEVQAIDPGNNTAIITHTFIVDLMPPVVFINQRPTLISNHAMAKFSFSCSKTNCTFECSLVQEMDTLVFPCNTQFYTSPLLQHNKTYTFTVLPIDDVENRGQDTFYTWTTDFVSPQISAIRNVSTHCSETNPEITGTPTAIDNRPEPVSLTYHDSFSECITQRVWTATDVAGNTDSFVQFISLEFSVSISSAPILAFPCDNASGTFELPVTVYSPNPCQLPLDLSFVDSVSQFTCPGEFTRNWTAQACGGIASTSQLIRFFDSCSPNACGRNESPPRGICSFGQCSCNRPWFGSNCSRLIFEPEIFSPNSTVLEEAEQYVISITLIRGTPPFFWTLVTAPNGLRLNGNTKQIAWTQAQVGNHTITVQVENEVGMSTASWTLIVRPGYTASINPVSPTVYPRAQPILLTGTVEYFDNNLVHGVQDGIVPIIIDINSGNSIRVISTFAKNNGSFSAVFSPASTEFGSYTARARHPNNAPSGSPTSWRILGMRAEPSYITLSGEINGLYHAVFYNTTMICGSVGITGIVPSVLFLNLNELSVSVFLNQDSLSSSSDDCVHVSMEVNSNRPLNRLFLVEFTADHGTITSTIVNVQIIQALPKIEVSPRNINTRITRGSFSILEFTITNLGKSTANNIQPVVPDTPVFSFISLGNNVSSYGDGQFNLDNGESASLSIQAMVSEDMPLGEITASLYIVSDEVYQQIPVSLTVSSNLLMNLTIVVEDEYTYFASGAPLVDDAVVTLINYQRNIRTTVTTEERRGSAFFMNIYEDRYEIFIEAPNHRPLHQVMLITFNNPKHTIFIFRQSVTYRWTVTPIPFTDTYELTLESDFETHVPVPVVTVSPTDIDLDEFLAGRRAFFVLNITNHGLIRADNIIIDVPPINDPSLEVSVDNKALGNLEALSSVTVVVHISRKLVQKRALGFISRVKWVAYPLRIYFSYVCGDVKRQSIPVVLRRKLPSDGYVPGPAVEYVRGNSPFRGDSGGDLPDIPLSMCGPRCTIFSNLGEPGDSDPQLESTFKFDGFLSGITEGSCDNCVTAVLRCIPKPDFPFSNCIPLFQRVANGEDLINTENFTSIVTDTKKWISCLVGDRWLPKIARDIESARELLVAGGCLFEASKRCLNQANSERNKRQSLPSIMRNHLESMYPILVSINLAVEILGDQVWLSVGDSQWVSQVLQPALDDASELGVLISNVELTVMLSAEPPSGITVEDVERLVNRLNNTINGWNSGVLEPVEGANMASYSFIESGTNEINKYNIKAINKGFTSYLDAYAYSVNDLNQLDRWPDEEQGVCAVVRIRIEQELAITREAFLAKLEIENQEDTNLEQMTIEIIITSTNTGVFSTNKFAISNETLSGSLVRAGDSWTLLSEESGSVEWLIVPLSEAAPQIDHVYAVGGTLRYTVDNENITVPLLPTLITVAPDPSLLVHYFWERTVIGDDPFTEEVEPSVPFTLGVIVKNAGYGEASNLVLSSGQPEIIDNERGLLVDFMIIGANIGNGSVIPSLSLTLGDLNPQSTVVVRWFMVSSLQGEFKNFSATFENVNPLGDPRLSVLDQLEIHELTRNVKIYNEGDDGILDFLVNRQPDARAYPDTLYDSKTLTRYNVSRGEVISIHFVSATTFEVVTSTNKTGWNYYRYTDSSSSLPQTAFTLNTSKQSSNGTVQIPFENSWITLDRINEVLVFHLVDFIDNTEDLHITFEITLCITNCPATSIPIIRPTGTPPTTIMVPTTAPTTGSEENSVTTVSDATSGSGSDQSGNTGSGQSGSGGSGSGSFGSGQSGSGGSGSDGSTSGNGIESTEQGTEGVTTTEVSSLLETTESATLPPEFVNSAVKITLSGFTVEKFDDSIKEMFKEATVMVINTYCLKELQRCLKFQSRIRRQTNSELELTTDSIILMDIKDEGGILTFLMYIKLKGGTLLANDLHQAIEEGQNIYKDVGFSEVLSQPFLLATEAPNASNQLSVEVIAGTVAGIGIVILVISVLIIIGVSYIKHHKKSMNIDSSLEYINPVRYTKAEKSLFV